MAAKVAIAVCTPTLGMVHMLWTKALLNLVWPMNTAKCILPMLDKHGGQIAEVRNRLVHEVLGCEKPGELEVSHIFWLDDDVIVERPAMLALLAHDRDIASGVYFDKGEGPNQPLIFPGPSAGVGKFKPGEVFESWGWAQGLSLVSTAVYRRMRDELDLGKDRYGITAWYKVPDFACDKDGFVTAGGTEDFAFFAAADKLGYKALVDCTRHAFGWHYDGKTGHPVKQWEQLMAGKPVEWETPEGTVTWG